MLNSSFLLILTVISLLFTVPNAVQAGIVKVSYLLSSDGLSKAVVMYDLHDYLKDPSGIEGGLAKAQLAETTRLLENLSSSGRNIEYYMELPKEDERDPVRYSPERLEGSAILLPGSIALKKSNSSPETSTQPSVRFIPFDSRNSHDYWVRDVLVQSESLAIYRAKGFKFPKEFNELSLNVFLKQLHERRRHTVGLVKSMVIAEFRKDQLIKKFEEVNGRISKLILEMAHRLKFPLESHLLDFALKVRGSDIGEKLFLAMFDEVSQSVDINLLSLFIQSSQNLNPQSLNPQNLNPMIRIIHAGAAHATAMERVLLSDFAYRHAEGFQSVNSNYYCDVSNLSVSPSQQVFDFSKSILNFIEFNSNGLDCGPYGVPYGITHRSHLAGPLNRSSLWLLKPRNSSLGLIDKI